MTKENNLDLESAIEIIKEIKQRFTCDIVTSDWKVFLSSFFCFYLFQLNELVSERNLFMQKIKRRKKQHQNKRQLKFKNSLVADNFLIIIWCATIARRTPTPSLTPTERIHDGIRFDYNHILSSFAFNILWRFFALSWNQNYFWFLLSNLIPFS